MKLRKGAAAGNYLAIPNLLEFAFKHSRRGKHPSVVLRRSIFWRHHNRIVVYRRRLWLSFPLR
jgi:hypothetical protein